MSIFSHKNAVSDSHENGHKLKVNFKQTVKYEIKNTNI